MNDRIYITLSREGKGIPEGGDIEMNRYYFYYYTSKSMWSEFEGIVGGGEFVLGEDNLKLQINKFLGRFNCSQVDFADSSWQEISSRLKNPIIKTITNHNKSLT